MIKVSKVLFSILIDTFIYSVRCVKMLERNNQLHARETVGKNGEGDR